MRNEKYESVKVTAGCQPAVVPTWDVTEKSGC